MKVGTTKGIILSSSNTVINHSMKDNIAAGIFFYASDTKRFLYLLRNDNKNQVTGEYPAVK